VPYGIANGNPKSERTKGADTEIFQRICKAYLLFQEIRDRIGYFNPYTIPIAVDFVAGSEFWYSVVSGGRASMTKQSSVRRLLLSENAQ
jgi:hypothetical protein